MDRLGLVLTLAMLTTVMGNEDRVPMKTKAVTLSRHFQGDIFFGQGDECSASYCTANGVRSARPVRWGSCHCQCTLETPVFREDTSQCVSTIDECMLADYVNGANAEKVPFVFLPQKGHLINPNAEIALSDIRTEGQTVLSPVCVVSKAHYLSQGGWIPVENSSAVEPPFALYRDAGRTYLQWLGETKLRVLLEGRILLVKLLCKDMTNVKVGIFSPCIAFRVAGTPGFANASMLEDGNIATTVGLKSGDYMAIGVSAGLLGALYIAALIAYMYYRRRRRRTQTKHQKLLASPGSPVVEEGVMGLNPFMQNRGHFLHPVNPNEDVAANFGGVRHNPLFQDNGRRQTTAVVHPIKASVKQDGGTTEKEFNDPKVYSTNNYPSGEHGKQIYYGQQYLDPTLLKTPPPAALEFLSKIRDMMGVAKNKMVTRRFMPSLIDIPEEYGYGSARGMGHQLQRIPSNSRRERHSDSESIYDTLRRGISSLKRTVSRSFRAERSETIDRAQMIEDKSLERSDEGESVQGPEIRPTMLQKSPLPARHKAAEPYAMFARPTTNKPFVSIYTNPSIEDIYNSLGRKREDNVVNHYDEPPPQGENSAPVEPVITTEGHLESQEDTSLDTNYEANTLNNVKSYEADSLDRRGSSQRIQDRPATVTDQQTSLPRTHKYEKNTRYKKARPEPPRQSLEQDMRHDQDSQSEKADDGPGNEGYVSSTSTTKSVKSLSRILPKEEEIEASNQLFNMNTGAKTLPRKYAKHLVEATDSDHIYECIGNNRDQRKGSESPCSERSYSSTSSSVQTVLEPSKNEKERGRHIGKKSDKNDSKNKISPTTSMEGNYDDFSSITSSTTQLTADVYEEVGKDDISVDIDEDDFEPDTLERRRFNNTQHSKKFVDSLERPMNPEPRLTNPNLLKVLTVQAPVSPSSSSGLGSSDSHASLSPRPKDSSLLTVIKPENRSHSRESNGSYHRQAGSSYPAINGLAEPPPRPPKRTSVAPQIPSRSLKPPRGPTLPPRSESSPPHLPPKNTKMTGTLRSSLERQDSSSSIESTVSDDSVEVKPRKVHNGQFVISNGEDTGLESKYERGSFSVLQRIAEIEREEARAQKQGDGETMTKGMEIALALKAKMDLEASLKDGRKSLSIKRTWRKLVEKVEDSFSETECASSATSSIAGTLRLAQKKKKDKEPSKDGFSRSESVSRTSSVFSSTKSGSSTSRSTDDHLTELDSESRSLGSDDTGDAETDSTKPVTLKSYYTFGEDNAHHPPQTFVYGQFNKRENSNVTKPPRNLKRSSMSPNNDSFDSGLYSSSSVKTPTAVVD